MGYNTGKRESSRLGIHRTIHQHAWTKEKIQMKERSGTKGSTGEKTNLNTAMRDKHARESRNDTRNGVGLRSRIKPRK